MAGAMVTFDLDPGLYANALAALARLGGSSLDRISYDVGEFLEVSARARISDTKTAPDGTPWAPWSEAYDETRNHSQHSLLVNRNDLFDSIQNDTTGETIMVGTNVEYAAHQQFGSGRAVGGIPARPFLGLSGDDRKAITDLVIGRLEDLLQ
jgi:phage virion morphogenesis protein